MTYQQASDIFDHYRVQKILATKETSSTYLASAFEHTHHQVVVKVFNRAYVHTTEDEKKTEAYFKILLSLHHRWLAPLLDIVFNDTQLYLVHPYLTHGSLRERINNLPSGRMAWEEALITVLKIGQALAYAHNHTITHASIKPENILYNDKDDVMLEDFSLAPAIRFNTFNTLTSPSNLRTTCYMAPEQFVGTMHYLSDQYALACLAYELFVGHPPFEAQTLTAMWNKHANEQPASLSVLAPHIPHSISHAISKALAKDPYQRYPDIATFLLELEYGSDLLSLRTVATQKLERTSYAVEINTSFAKKSDTRTARLIAYKENPVSNSGSLAPLPATTAILPTIKTSHPITNPLPTSSKRLFITPTQLFVKPGAPLLDPDDETMTMFTAGEPAQLTPSPITDELATTTGNNQPPLNPNTDALTASSHSIYKHLNQPLFWITIILVAFTIACSIAFLLFGQQNRLSQARADMHTQAIAATATTHAAIQVQSQPQKSLQPTQKVASSKQTPAVSSSGHNPIITPANNTSTRINAGGRQVGDFVADTDYSDPTKTPCDGTDHTIDLSHVSHPAPQAVYQDNRCAPSFSYTLSKLQPHATYTIRLHFAETYWTQPGQRIFSVTINGRLVLPHFDIIAATGGRYRAIVEQFTTTGTTNGQITIAFSAIHDNALLSGLEILHS